MHPATRRQRAGAVLWVVAPVGYLLLEATAAAAFKPDYSYANNYISDLGLVTIDSPRAHLMHAAFALQGIGFLVGPLLMVGVPRSNRARLFLSLGAANAVGNILVGAVHAGKLHTTGAVLAIVGGNAAILAGSAVIEALSAPTAGQRWYRGISKLIAAVGLLCFVMLGLDSAKIVTGVLPKGIWERGSVYSILLWQLLTAACLLRRPGGQRHPRL